MKFTINLIFGLIIFFSHLACTQQVDYKTEKALQIVNSNEQSLDSIEQLIVVFNDKPESHKATLVAVQKVNNVWVAKYKPLPSGIGRNGFASPNNKIEGDGKSPTGLFSLGHLFCYDKDVNTSMTYTQTTNEDKWIDDPNSNDYNKHISGETTANSYENLKLQSNSYKYCMVVEYNTNPVIKNMGSAIFFHLGYEYEPTAGCVTITEENMEFILKWLNPKYNPAIIMGNKNILQNGLNK